MSISLVLKVHTIQDLAKTLSLKIAFAFLIFLFSIGTGYSQTELTNLSFEGMLSKSRNAYLTQFELSKNESLYKNYFTQNFVNDNSVRAATEVSQLAIHFYSSNGPETRCDEFLGLAKKWLDQGVSEEVVSNSWLQGRAYAKVLPAITWLARNPQATIEEAKLAGIAAFFKPSALEVFLFESQVQPQIDEFLLLQYEIGRLHREPSKIIQPFYEKRLTLKKSLLKASKGFSNRLNYFSLVERGEIYHEMGRAPGAHPTQIGEISFPLYFAQRYEKWNVIGRMSSWLDEKYTESVIGSGFTEEEIMTNSTLRFGKMLMSLGKASAGSALILSSAGLGALPVSVSSVPVAVSALKAPALIAGGMSLTTSSAIELYASANAEYSFNAFRLAENTLHGTAGSLMFMGAVGQIAKGIGLSTHPITGYVTAKSLDITDAVGDIPETHGMFLGAHGKRQYLAALIIAGVNVVDTFDVSLAGIGGLKTVSSPIGKNNDLDADALATIRKAEKILVRDLSDAERIDILEVHEIGKNTVGKDGNSPSAVNNYNETDIYQKARKLKDSGFTKEERSKLIRNGVVGESVTLMKNTLNEYQDLIDGSPEFANLTNYEKRILIRAATIADKPITEIGLQFSQLSLIPQLKTFFKLLEKDTIPRLVVSTNETANKKSESISVRAAFVEASLYSGISVNDFVKAFFLNFYISDRSTLQAQLLATASIANGRSTHSALSIVEALSRSKFLESKHAHLKYLYLAEASRQEYPDSFVATMFYERGLAPALLKSDNYEAFRSKILTQSRQEVMEVVPWLTKVFALEKGNSRNVDALRLFWTSLINEFSLVTAASAASLARAWADTQITVPGLLVLDQFLITRLYAQGLINFKPDHGFYDFSELSGIQSEVRSSLITYSLIRDHALSLRAEALQQVRSYPNNLSEGNRRELNSIQPYKGEKKARKQPSAKRAAQWDAQARALVDLFLNTSFSNLHTDSKRTLLMAKQTIWNGIGKLLESDFSEIKKLQEKRYALSEEEAVRAYVVLHAREQNSYPTLEAIFKNETLESLDLVEKSFLASLAHSKNVGVSSEIFQSWLADLVQLKARFRPFESLSNKYLVLARGASAKSPFLILNNTLRNEEFESFLNHTEPGGYSDFVNANLSFIAENAIRSGRKYAQVTDLVILAEYIKEEQNSELLTRLFVQSEVPPLLIDNAYSILKSQFSGEIQESDIVRLTQVALLQEKKRVMISHLSRPMVEFEKFTLEDRSLIISTLMLGENLGKVEPFNEPKGYVRYYHTDPKKIESIEVSSTQEVSPPTDVETILDDEEATAEAVEQAMKVLLSRKSTPVAFSVLLTNMFPKDSADAFQAMRALNCIVELNKEKFVFEVNGDTLSLNDRVDKSFQPNVDELYIKRYLEAHEGEYLSATDLSEVTYGTALLRSRINQMLLSEFFKKEMRTGRMEVRVGADIWVRAISDFDRIQSSKLNIENIFSPSLYERLGVNSYTTTEEINNRFGTLLAELSKEYSRNTIVLEKLTEAFRVLSDTQAREKYNEEFGFSSAKEEEISQDDLKSLYGDKARFTSDFLNNFEELQDKDKVLAKRRLELLLENPQHPSLRSHEIDGLSAKYDKIIFTAAFEGLPGGRRVLWTRDSDGKPYILKLILHPKSKKHYGRIPIYFD